MLKLLVMLASIANCAGGVVLIGTWATMWQRVPIIVLFIGGSLLIQGAYTILYLRGDLDRWGDLATGALFAGEGLSACVGAGGLIQGIIHNVNNADMEMAPVLAGLLMLFQAVLALLYLSVSGRLRPAVQRRTSAGG
ncbi:MAG TPA: hypothetical protein DGB72_12370 [Gemmatimonadetes bacterium]|jgi:hypothetical protein|nr:hypothetical protein [Gemmatimonadota bacterium]